MDCLNKVHFIIPACILAAGAVVFAADSETATSVDAPVDPPQHGWRLDGDAFLQLGAGIETEHTPWMNPSATGAIRALFLVNQIAAYDVGELGRRLEMDIAGMPADTWLRLGSNYWLHLWMETSGSSEKSAYFETMLDDQYDVIVLGNYRFLSLYDSVQYKILEQVYNGAGLVMFYSHDVDPRMLEKPLKDVSDELAAGIPFSGLKFYRNIFMLRKDLLWPEQIGSELIHAYQFGRGRIVLVDYASQPSVFKAVPGAITPFEDYDYEAPVQYDYHQALAARCLMWAAGRQPRLQWHDSLPGNIDAAAGVSPGELTLHGTWLGKSSKTLDASWRVRNQWNDIVQEASESREVSPGKTSWTLQIDPLPGGDHFVDLMVSSEDGNENWASVCVTVRSDLSIDAIQPVSTFFEAGQNVTGRVFLSRPVEADERCVARLRLEDGYGRLFARAEAHGESGSDRIAFEMVPGNLVAWGGRLRVELQVDAQLLDRDETEIWFRRPSRGEFPIAMWGAIPGYGNHIGNLQMRELGFTAVLAESPISQARDDLGWMTFGPGRGALIHSLGDEIPVPYPNKGEQFGSFLEDQYEQLDALNAAWGTSYSNWNEAQPRGRAKDGDAASFVQMHDTLSCGEWLHAERCRRGRESCEATNPPGVVGPEGSPVGDPELTLPEVTFWGPYLTVRDNLLVNAIADRSILRGNWFGGYVEDRQIETRLRHVLWLSILGGNNMIEYFMVNGGLLAPDLTLMPFTEQFMKSWHQLRLGLGPLLAGCEPTRHPVAVLHSQPSEHVGRAGGQSTDTTKVHEYMLNLLGDAGYCPQFVATGQLLDGRLREGDIRVLMLLHAFALSDETIEEIERFVRQGGIVVADIPPAWFDENCRLRDQRGMDALFGLEPTSPEPSLRHRLDRMDQLGQLELDEHRILVRGLDESSETSDQPTTSVQYRQLGDGQCVMLGGVIWQESMEDEASADGLRYLLEEKLDIARPFQVEFEQPLGKTGIKVYSYARGEIDVHAVLPPEATDPEIAVVPLMKFEKKRHTYDVRESRYLGYLDDVEVEVDRSSPMVIARMDYKVDGVRVEVPAEAEPGVDVPFLVWAVDFNGRPQANHVIRVDVKDPEGNPAPQYGAILSKAEAKKPWHLPLALNDPEGNWEIRATDVISGKSNFGILRVTSDNGAEADELR